MVEKTWEPIVEVIAPINVSDLETTVLEGDNLNFSISQANLLNMVNTYWNAFVTDMAKRCETELLDALSKGDTVRFGRIMGHIAGISSMYRLSNATLTENTLELKLGVTTFNQYIGTTQRALHDSQFREMLIQAGISDHSDPNFYFSNPLATCAALVTSDRKIPIGIRSQNVAIYPGVPHIIGGYVKVNGENNPCFTAQDVNVFSNMKKELEQEMGLTDQDIDSAVFLGISRNRITRGPEAMYVVFLKIPAAELDSRWRTKSRDKHEHRNITYYPQQDIPDFLRQNQGTMVPPGEATLSLFTQHYL